MICLLSKNVFIFYITDLYNDIALVYISAICIYSNADTQKSSILAAPNFLNYYNNSKNKPSTPLAGVRRAENVNKSGVYCWKNLISGKTYPF